MPYPVSALPYRPKSFQQKRIALLFILYLFYSLKPQTAKNKNPLKKAPPNSSQKSKVKGQK
jgi:hypothetical protein